jgi:hypothetical protein
MVSSPRRRSHISNESLGTIKGSETLDQLSVYQLLKKGSVIDKTDEKRLGSS